MRIGLIILIGIHGVIHLFGFLKAFHITDFDAISQHITKNCGIIWLLTFLLFAITVFLKLVHSDYWWLVGFLAVVISQGLIFNYWSDAKFGSIINLIFLLTIITGFANFNFQHLIKAERSALYKNSQLLNQGMLSKEDLLDLPLVVQKWLINSGSIDKPPISTMFLVQELQLKLRPEQKNWSIGQAEQHFTLNPPAFIWNIDTEMNSILSVAGRDKFEDGKGEMIIKLLSLIPVVDAKNHEKLNQATLQRFLAEIVWFPSAALSKHIKWESIDNNSARATMEYKGTKGSGEFHFDENGNFEKFIAMRYRDFKDSKPTQWAVKAIRTKEMSGIKIPVECEASWELEIGEWTWLKLKIIHTEYNMENIPLD